MKNLENFVRKGQDAQRAVDREIDRHELRLAINGVQTTVERTDEDDTRTRMREVLKLLQGLEGRMEGK